MIMIFGEQFIELAGTKSTILAENAIKCKKVSLDIQKIKKPDKVFKAYDIPAEERLIAYCKGTLSLFGLTLDGLVFTDKAFYPFPRDTDPLPSNRISYDDLCKYIITQESGKGAVCLQNADIEYEIYSSTLVRQNTAGHEIQLVLEAVQTELCHQSLSSRKTMDNTVAAVFDRVKAEMKCNVLSQRTKTTLKALSMKPDYCDDAACLLAEDIFRQCDSAAYHSFLEDISINISAETKEKLTQPPMRFSDNLLKDLSNPSISFSKTYLDRAYYNLRKVSETLSQTYLSAYALVCMRLTHCDTAREIVLELIQRYGITAAYIVEDFICIYGNQQMQRVFEAISKGKKIEEDLLCLRDGLGLTPLHYAMILQNEEILEDIICKKDWSEEGQYLTTDHFRDTYDYQVLACAKPELNQPQIFCYVNPDVQAISDAIITLERQQKEMLQVLVEISDTIREAGHRLHKMESDGANVFEVEPLKQSLWEMHESSRKLNSALAELPEQLENAKKERNRIYKAAVFKSSETLNRLRRDNNPATQLFLRIYENNESFDNLAKIFSDFGDHSSVRMYQLGSFYFALPETISLELPYRTVCVTSDGIEDDGILKRSNGTAKPCCLYGDSWFSPQAHTDISVLKDEYRKLAKQYHPDACSQTYAEELFKKIASEYEELRMR